MFFRFVRNAFLVLCLLAATTAFAGVFSVAVLYQKLPTLDNFTAYRPRLPMRIYSADNVLIGEFGAERRQVLAYHQFPPKLINALLATEDARFFEHRGVDFVGIGRAALGYIDGRREGASTITMQLARNLYLTHERTIVRKLLEMMLALRIELYFRKEDILALYMNHIYLGHGSYGFAASAREYYGKPLEELNDAEIAMLAGLPKAPSGVNPRSYPAQAKNRQRHVLRRMRDTGVIDEATYAALRDAPLPPLAASARRLPGAADYVAEEVRRLVFDYFGEAAYERGFRIYTTIQHDLQQAAQQAVRRGLLAHQWRRAYSGAEQYLDTRNFEEEDYDRALREFAVIAGLRPAIVLRATRTQLRLREQDGTVHTLAGKALERVARHLPGGRKPVLRAGAVVRLAGEGDDLRVTDLPRAQAALVALSSDEGAVLALVGGMDFSHNQFNNATQARRQPGSVLKPFFYSAALEKGLTPASLLPDTPIFLSAAETGSGESWQPKNYDGKALGPITMREALAKSKNLAAIQMMKYIGVHYARDYLLRFGFRRDDHLPYLTLVLGAGGATPIELARAYAAFSNGGFLVYPYLITRIEDFDGNQIINEFDYQTRRQIIDRRNAFLMASLLHTVISEGTGRRANVLERQDIGGKTGTTNDTRDAWFSGYGGNITAVSWIGYGNNKSLGDKETGARAALPIWLNFMQAALAHVPEQEQLIPPGIITAEVDKKSGKILSGEAGADGRREYFYTEYLPSGGGDSGEVAPSSSELF